MRSRLGIGAALAVIIAVVAMVTVSVLGLGSGADGGRQAAPSSTAPGLAPQAPSPAAVAAPLAAQPLPVEAPSTGALRRAAGESAAGQNAATQDSAGQDTAAPAAQAPAGVGSMRIEVPAVGVDLPVQPITPAGGPLDPPTLQDAYWIEPYGVPGADADNTAYIVAHSWDEGEAAFNPLFDQESQTSEVDPGDEIVVTTEQGRFTYVVQETRRYPKDSLADAEDVWRIVPGRLVLITCFQPDDGAASTDNLVVYSHLVSADETAAQDPTGAQGPSD